jgi:DNA polymerase III alpha subunit
MSILVTGGLGFIGSHTVVELIKNKNENIIILDNLINSKIEVLDKIKKITNNDNITFIKMDILGLQNLTTLDTAIKIIETRHKTKINPDEIPLDDPNTFSVLRKANTLGIFQLESNGMTDLVARSQVSSFEEIVALIALYRPGPMDSGMLSDYLDRKSGKLKVIYPHLERIGYQ